MRIGLRRYHNQPQVIFTELSDRASRVKKGLPSTLPPMHEPIMPSSSPTPPSTLAYDNQRQMTTLDNGIKVVSQYRPGGCCEVGIFRGDGSYHEPLPGLAQLLSSAFFMGGATYYGEQSSEPIFNLYADYKRFCYHDMMGNTFTLGSDKVASGLAILVDKLKTPIRTENDLVAAKEICYNELIDRDVDGKKRVVDHAYYHHYQAERGTTVAPSKEDIDRIGLEDILGYHQQVTSNGNSIVVGLVGDVEHGALVDLCHQLTHTIPSGSTIQILDEQIKWTPSTLPTFERIPISPALQVEMDNRLMEDDICMFLGFPSPPISHPDSYARSIYRSLMGSGASFSPGGPGKGVRSLLYQTVMHREYWIEAAR